MTDDTNSSGKTNRRTLLRGIAGATSAGIGIASGFNPASAAKSRHEVKENVKRAMDEFSTSETIQLAINKHASHVIATLATHGYLRSDSIAELNIETPSKMAEYQNADNAVNVTAFKEGGSYTAHIAIKNETPDHVVKIYLQPQLDRAYALVESKDGEELEMIDPTKDEVTTQECWDNGKTCPASCCSYPLDCENNKVYTERCCFSGGDAECYNYDPSGCCDPLIGV